ncbi:MAG: hypothetical protein WBX01_04720 [Nitrososphaeraceae archaeon]
MTLEEICPTWSNKLKAGVDKDDLHTLIRKPEMCVVGEAWGYTSRYLGYGVVYLIPFIGCWKCIKYGNKIGKTAKQHKELCRDYLQPIIDDFVDHWNVKHHEITLKKNIENNVAELNPVIN